MSFSKWRVYFVHQALLYQTRYIHGGGWVTCNGGACSVQNEAGYRQKSGAFGLDPDENFHPRHRSV